MTVNRPDILLAVLMFSILAVVFIMFRDGLWVLKLKDLKPRHPDERRKCQDE